jgi:disulfide bond formation protein DsbB
MQTFASITSTLWSTLSVVAELISIILILSLFSQKLFASRFVGFFKKHGIAVAFIVALLATLGSLAYSDIIGYEPCKLCWLQRIFMYPLVILMGVALWRKDSWMKLYGIILSVIGGAIALFHYTGQIGLTPLPCSAVGYSASCAQRFVMEFGYITIPMMAFSAFLLIVFTLIVSMKKEEPAQNL